MQEDYIFRCLIYKSMHIIFLYSIIYKINLADPYPLHFQYDKKNFPQKFHKIVAHRSSICDLKS